MIKRADGILATPFTPAQLSLPQNTIAFSHGAIDGPGGLPSSPDVHSYRNPAFQSVALPWLRPGKACQEEGNNGQQTTRDGLTLCTHACR